MRVDHHSWKRVYFVGALRSFVVLAMVGVVVESATLNPTAAAAAERTITFHFTGKLQTFTVPNGMYNVPMTVSGAAGANGQGTNGGGGGGSGGQVTATLPVRPGDVLTLFVGQHGDVFGGGGQGDPGFVSWNGGQGGAFGGGQSGNGGGGGAASYVYLGGVPLLVAGGGGGGGGGGVVVNYHGGNGGPGGLPPGGGGGGSGLGSGGGGGANPTGVTSGGSGSDGTLVGGGGGGGGGGYASGTGGGGGFSGGGGGGGGGGGTSFADPSAIAVSFASRGNAQSTNGQISLDLGPAGTTQSFTATSQGDYQYFTVPSNVNSLQITIDGASGGDGRPSPTITGFHAGTGGSGGEVSGTLSVTPGQILALWVGHGGQEGGQTIGLLHQDLGAGGQGNPSGDNFNGGHGGECNGAPFDCSGWGDPGGGGSAGYVIANGAAVLVAGGGGGGGATAGPFDPEDFGPGGDGGQGGSPASVGAQPDYKGFAGGHGGITGLAGNDGGAGADRTITPTHVGQGGAGGGGGGGVSAGGGGGAGSHYVDPTPFIDTGGGGGGGGSSFSAGSVTDAYFSSADNRPGTDAPGNDGSITISYRPATVTTIASSANPVGPQQAVTYTATVTGNGGGTVDFTSDGQDIAGCGIAPVGANRATCTTTDTFPGSHLISANYSGDVTDGPSAASLTEVVNNYPNAATLTASANPSAVGQSVTFELTGFSSTGTGTVTFSSDGATVPGCVALPVVQRLTSQPWFSDCATAALGAGPHAITATYSGDRLFAPASASLTERVIGPVDQIVLSPATAKISRGGSQIYHVEGFDAVGDDLGDFTAQSTLSIGPDGSCSGASCGASLPGGHGVTATLSNGLRSSTSALFVTNTSRITLSPASSQLTSPAHQTYQAEGFDPAGNDLGDVTSDTTFTISPSGSCTANICFATQVRSYTITGDDGGVTATAALNVGSSPVYFFTLTPPLARIAPGGAVAYHAEGFDAEGHDLGDVTAQATFSITPDGSCSGATCGASAFGTHSVSATVAFATTTAELDVNRPFGLHLAPDSFAITLGSSQTYHASAIDINGDPLGDVTAQTTFTMDGDGSCVVATCTPAHAGPHTVRGQDGIAGGSADLLATPAPVDHLVVAPATSTVAVGSPRLFHAEGFDSFGNDLGDVTGQATFTVSPGGSCTAASCTPTTAGDHTVTATDGTATGAATLTVTAGSLDHLVLSPPSTSLVAGASQTYSAEGFDHFGNDLGDATGATTFTIGPDGTCTAATCRASTVGAHTITGTNGNATGTATLTVTAGSLDHLVLSPPSTSLVAGASQTYSAEGFDHFGNDLGDATGATTFTIGPDGTCTAATCRASTVGAHTVTGTNGNATGTATLTVTAGSLDHLMLSPPSTSLVAGASQTYSAEGFDHFGNDLGDATGATTFTIGPDGTCTAATCRASTVGAHTVTGTNGNATGAATLTVTAGSLDHLVLSPPSTPMVAGASQTYSAEGFDHFGNDLGDATGATTFTIGPDGTCTAATCRASTVGAHTVTGTNGNATGAASLTVTAGSLDHLMLSPPSTPMVAGASQTYSAEGFDHFGNDLGDATGATTFTIGPDGTCTAATCRASTVGAHTVTGTNGNATGTASLTVTAGPLDHLVLSPPSTPLVAGASQTYSAEGFDHFGNDLGDATGATTFTIGPDGTCTAATCRASTVGAHTVTGTNGNATGTASLTVTAGPLDHLMLSPPSTPLVAGASQTYSAEGFDHFGNDLGDATGATTFTIGPDGTCTAATCRASTVGAHTVTGTNGNATGTASLTVTAGPLDHLVLSPAAATAVVGTSEAYSAEGFDHFGNDLGDATGATTFTIGPNGTCNGATCVPVEAGNHTITGRAANGATGSATLLVTPGPLDYLTLSPASATVVVGVPQSYKAEAFDHFGDDLGDVTAQTHFTISPNGSCVAATCTAPRTGTHTVLGSDGIATGTASLIVTLIPTTVTVVATPTIFGAAITLTATVVRGTSTVLNPTGAVSFSVDGTAVRSASLTTTRTASVSFSGLMPGPHVITASYGGDSNFAASGGSATTTIGCATTLTGRQSSLVVATAGVCIDHAQVKGPVVLVGAGSVAITNSSVSGELIDVRAGALSVCGTSIGGNITVNDANGFVLIGDPGDDHCAGNTIGGVMTVTNNTRGLEVVGNRYHLALIAFGNSGQGPFSSKPEISGNTIG